MKLSCYIIHILVFAFSVSTSVEASESANCTEIDPDDKNTGVTSSELDTNPYLLNQTSSAEVITTRNLKRKRSSSSEGDIAIKPKTTCLDAEILIETPSLSLEESTASANAIETTDVEEIKKVIILPANILLQIASFLKFSQDSTRSFFYYTRCVFDTQYITIPKLIACRYNNMPLLEESSQLVWFLRPPPHSSSDPYVMCRFIISLTQDLRMFSSEDSQNRNQIILCEYILNYITSSARTEAERSFYNDDTSSSNSLSIVEELSVHLFNCKQFVLLKRLILSYPSRLYDIFSNNISYEDNTDIFKFLLFLETEEYLMFLVAQLKIMIEYEDHPKVGFCRKHMLKLFTVLVFSFSRLSPQVMLNQVFIPFQYAESKFPEMFYESFFNFCISDYFNETDNETTQFLRNLEYFAHFKSIFTEPLSIKYINQTSLLNSVRFDRSFDRIQNTTDYLSLSYLSSLDVLEALTAVAVVGNKQNLFEVLYPHFKTEISSIFYNCYSTLFHVILKNIKNCSWAVQEVRTRQPDLLPDLLNDLFSFMLKHNSFSGDINASIAIIDLILREREIGYNSVDSYLLNQNVPIEVRLKIFTIVSGDLRTLNQMLQNDKIGNYSRSDIGSALFTVLNSSKFTSECDFEACLKTLKKLASNLGVVKSGISAHSTGESISKIYKNPNLHEIFDCFRIQLSHHSILKVVKLPELSQELRIQKAKFGQKFELIEYHTVLKELRLYSEFTAFFDLLSEVDQETILLSSLYGCLRDIFSLYSRRHILLYWLHIGSFQDSFWNKLPVKCLNLLYLEAPEELKESFNKYLESQECKDKKNQLKEKFRKICQTTNPY